MLTPFQTVGPFLSLGLQAGLEPLATGDPHSLISICGQLFDGAGHGIPDGVLEWWHPSLPSIQRSLTAADGTYRVETIKPPVVVERDGRKHASHLAVRVLGRGILTQYVTRLYFADDTELATDPILNLVPVHRRTTLLARRESALQYRFDVIVQGENETVFFDF